MQVRRFRLSSKTVVAGKGRKGRCQKEDECLGVCAGDNRVLVRGDTWRSSKEVQSRAGDGLDAGH